MTRPAEFDARGYWEQRLGQDYDLRGVGFRRLGRRYNAWAYRLRAEVFARVAGELVPDPEAVKVLDIGSGTGFYIDAWTRLGVTDLTGVDITDAAVGNLAKKFPDVPFIRGDVSDGLPELTPASYDVVTAMDVLFHIVDDDRFAAALASIQGLLKPGGVLLYSDLFLHDQEIREPHVVYRRLAQIEQAAKNAGLTVVRRQPVFVTMIQPVDTDSRLLRGAWVAFGGLASLAEPIGGLVGRVVYAIDSRLVKRRSESPSIEIMTLRKS